MPQPKAELVQQHMLAKSLDEDGQLEAAAKAYRSLLDAGLADGQIWFNLGFVYCRLGEHAQALECWDQCLQHDSESANTHNNRADSLLHLRRYDQAIEAAERAASMGSIEALHTLAECYEAKGQPERAIESLETIVTSATSEYNSVREHAVAMIDRLRRGDGGTQPKLASDPLQVYILGGSRKVQINPDAGAADADILEANSRRQARIKRLMELRRL